MTTPEPKTPPSSTEPLGNTWRDLVQSGAESARIEAFALEHLIDLQRSRARIPGSDR